MRKLFLLFTTGIICFSVLAQNPATVFTIPNKHITLPCGTHCTPISFSVPHIKQTNNYVITNPDDYWSQKIPFPFAFSFCFFGISYPTLLMGSNSAITFDTSKAGQGSGYVISATGGGIPNTAYAPSMIFGPYHDINPNLTSGNKKIEYRVEGIAPKRRFIDSYNNIQ